MVRILGAPELGADPRFCSFALRLQNREALVPLLKDLSQKRATDEWLERLKGKVPCAPVNTVAQAFADEQVVEDEMVLAMSHPDFGTVRQVASPVKISDYKKEHQRGPKLGEHTEEVLGEHLGLSHEEIEALRTEGVL